MSGAADDRLSRGWETLTRVNATQSPRVVAELDELAPDLARFVVEFGYGDCYERPTLEPRHRQLVTIGALVAMGGCEAQLAVHVAVGLNVGLSPDEVVEAVMHALPYVGFPRTLNAVAVVRSVFERRGVWTSDAWRGEPLLPLDPT